MRLALSDRATSWLRMPSLRALPIANIPDQTPVKIETGIRTLHFKDRFFLFLSPSV